MQAIIAALVGEVVKNARGEIKKKTKGLLTSATTQAATVGSAAGLYELVPKALDADAQAIGLVVLIVVAWLRTWYGRWRAGNMGKAPGK